MGKLRININGHELTGHSEQTILDVATENNIHIPTLCFSGDLEVYASCGLCLVEVEGMPRLLRACATKIADGMVIQTENEKIRKARKLALELILSDHLGDCRAPCVLACPINCDAQGYVALIANGQFKEALKLIKEYMPLPASIGRVCPAPCEDDCRRNLVEAPVSIRYLKRFVADLDMASDDPYVPEVKPDTGKKVAVVGSGPAGITAAYFLRRSGHHVSIFESLPEFGGMLRYGIPEYRLPKKILQAEIQQVFNLGVVGKANVQLGEDFTIDYLFKSGFDAIYLAIGAQDSRRMGVPGEDMPGVIGGTEFLRAVMLNENIELGNRVAIIGGGNTAMDAARTAKRLGSEQVTVVYRRAREQMPAQDIEVIEAEEEGVQFHLLAAPVKIEGNGTVEKMLCQKMQLGEPDASGRRRPEPIPDAYFTLEVDTIIAAIGQDVGIKNLRGEVAINKYNTIDIVEGTFLTNIPGIFAGGDAVTGPGIAVEAVAAGKRAAEVVNNYLRGKTTPYQTYFDIKKEGLTEEDYADREKQERVEMPFVAPEVRVKNFREIELGLTAEAARQDAQRCLECGCFDSFECKLRSYAKEYGAKPERIIGEKHDYEPEVHPFIIRDQNKCILCGLCVRTCSEIIGVEALGLVNRGFDVYVSPSLDLPLEQTSCVSCGQCVAVCPTGALMENMPLEKPAPWDFKKTRSVCGYCGVGCSIQIETVGDKIARIVPYQGKVNEGVLCRDGRFGFEFINNKERLRLPLVKENGVLKETTWEDALLSIAKKAKSIKARFGGESLALFASPRYTNEESYLLQKFARSVLGTNNINSFTEQANPLSGILGWGASTNSYAELASADFILTVGVDFPDYCIAILKIKQAVEKGAELWTIDHRDSDLKGYASRSFKPQADANINLFAAFLVCALQKGLVDHAFLEKYVGNFAEVKADLQDMNLADMLSETALTEDDIAALVEKYAAAKNPLLVLGSKDLSAGSVQLLSGLALLLGKVGLPRRGLLYLRNRCNSQGILDMGISPHYLTGYQKIDDADALQKFSSKWKVPLSSNGGKETTAILQGVANKEIKGIFIFGEDPGAATVAKLAAADLLVVQDLILTDTAKAADVVLPAASFAETNGSFTNSERRIQRFKAALEPLPGKENWQALLELMNLMGYQQKATTPDDLWAEIVSLTPIMSSINSNSLEEGATWPGVPVCNIEELVSVHGKLKFILPEKDVPAFESRESCDSMEKWFSAYLQEKGIN